MKTLSLRVGMRLGQKVVKMNWYTKMKRNIRARPSHSGQRAVVF
jgi:hypothetical protein